MCETATDVCTECKYPTNRSLPECDCDDEFFGGLTASTCTSCDSPCIKCVDSATKCLNCIFNYYLDGNTCNICNYKCSGCINSVTDCD